MCKAVGFMHSTKKKNRGEKSLEKTLPPPGPTAVGSVTGGAVMQLPHVHPSRAVTEVISFFIELFS